MASCPYSDQLLVTRKFWSPGANRPSQAKDEIVPKASVRRFVDTLAPEPQRRGRFAWYEDGCHMLLRDLQGPVAAADVATWALAPRSPLPSGADREAEEAFAHSASQASVDGR